jgi:hypothetical protein
MPTFETVRNWLIPLLAGLAAPTLLIWAWGALVAAIWFPGIGGLMEPHPVKSIRLWSFDASWFFDAGIGLGLGILLSLAVALAIRESFIRACLIFLLGFVAAAIAPSIPDGDFAVVKFFFLQPVVVFFGVASAATFSLWAKRRAKQNVP